MAPCVNFGQELRFIVGELFASDPVAHVGPTIVLLSIQAGNYYGEVKVGLKTNLIAHSITTQISPFINIIHLKHIKIILKLFFY